MVPDQDPQRSIGSSLETTKNTLISSSSATPFYFSTTRISALCWPHPSWADSSGHITSAQGPPPPPQQSLCTGAAASAAVFSLPVPSLVASTGATSLTVKATHWGTVCSESLAFSNSTAAVQHIHTRGTVRCHSSEVSYQWCWTLASNH